MAKSNKNTVPAIKPPSSGMMEWLNQNSNATQLPVTESAANQPVDVIQGVSIAEIPVEGIPKSDVAESAAFQPVTVGAEQGQIPSSSEDLENGITAPKLPVASTAPKVKSRGGEKGKSYPETFFKKPEKSDESGSDSKPIRISEESHWLLSVLVEQARRQGNKLTVGNLIENLLADHRLVHKQAVDELLADWKARKRIA